MNVWRDAQVLALASSDALVTRHVPPTEKQPAVRLRPFAKVDEAAPVRLSAVVCIPAPKVEVADPLMVVVERLLLMERIVVEALVKLVRPVTVRAPATVEDAEEMYPPVSVESPVTESVPELVVLLKKPVPEMESSEVEALVKLVRAVWVEDAFDIYPEVKVWS